MTTEKTGEEHTEVELTPEQEQEKQALEEKEAEAGFAAGYTKARGKPQTEEKTTTADEPTAEQSAAEKEAEEKAKAEAEAEAKAKAEAEAKAKADEEARAQAKAEEDRKFTETLPTRLRNIEGHIGGIKSALDQALAAGKAAATRTGADAPTDKQVAAAGSNSEKWKSLKEDFPEWAEAMEERLSAVLAQAKPGAAPAVNVEEIKAALAGDVGEAISEGLGQAEERAYVRMKHPTWRTTVNTPEFKSWLGTQPADVKSLAESEVGDDAVKLLDTFDAHKAKVAADAEARLKKDKRLASAVAPRTTGEQPQPGLSDEDAFNRGYKRGKGK